MKPDNYKTLIDNVNVLEEITPTLPAKRYKLDWVNTLFLVLTPIVAIALSIMYFKEATNVAPMIIAAVAFYFITGLSVTGGYHRLFSHRTYKAHPIIKIFFLLFGAASFQNSALKWSSDHRVHHNNVDDDHNDPYSIGKGFWWAHIGWIFYQDQHKEVKYPKDLLNDKYVMWQHKYYLPLAVIMGLALPMLIGYFLGSALGGLALIGFARVVFVHHCTFFINSLCHMVGTRPYTDTNTARDSAIMAVFSYGEGYHNYHHFFPNDYRNGIRWFHYDPTKWLIKTLSYFGLTGDLKKVPQKLIDKAKNEMREKYSN